ncbi:PREDICTED: 1-acyl-sn-glycerol-3-phosphate acyltransferase delta-like [Rhagoletis zephyria]|uniref:1-acyl-sn-glycerol-3-phosphate acyltransferase delta-like n=1 Tax=Rhagoletis zephyria TaxID=28612 RepID=UPI0008113D4E|nr:PREDICTED: 1-acyl-sn-glycerol-3-phosphate acyltransferase delta-like [Rhagoletis zephyria]
MGAGKAFTKVELKRMPIFGWSFFFGEFIFLQRNWKEDEKRIGPAIDQLVAHPFPITLLLLPEGTRFTSEKYQAAMKFVEERKIPINLKYHLLPRVKGFAATLGHLQKNHANNFGVYHCQLIARTKPPGEETFMPTLKSLIRGKPFNVDCYIEKIDTSRLPGAEATEAEHSAFLYTVFEKMDKLMDQHLKEDSFPKTAIMKVKRPSIFKALRFVLLNFVFSASLVYLLVYQAIVTHSFYLRLVIYSVIITVTGGLFLIYKRLQYSKYGGTGKKKE